MKRIAMILAAFCVLLTACAQNSNNQAITQSNNNTMNKIVIFFSHAGDNYVVGDNGANYITNIEVGNTKIVADYISEITGADQYEIVTHKYDGMAYTPLINLAQEEANKGELPPYEGAAPTSASTTPSSSAAPCGGAPIRR